MSIAIINASVAGSLVVAGPTTLSGSLLSSSTINSQGMTTQALNVNDISLNGSFICNLPAQTTGINNLVLGAGGGASKLISGSNNIGIGFQTLEQVITGSYNTALGYQSGLGVLGSENICIGRNSGINSSNVYNQSVCIGVNSDITASNQISLGTSNETVQIPGNMSIVGQINLSDTPLYLRGSDPNHYLQYNSVVDGPSLQGYNGGRLGTSSNSSVLTWNNNSITTGTGNFSGLAISGTTESTSTTIGTVTVKGGMGITGNVYIGGSLSASGACAFNVGSNGQFIVSQNNLTYAQWARYGTSGLQIGWNNDSGSGGTDFINNAQLGSGGNAFSFWRMSYTSQTPLKIASISPTGTGNFSGLAISGTTDSTSTTTGSVTVKGGLGIAGSAYIGGNLAASGACAFNTGSNGQLIVSQNNLTYSQWARYGSAGLQIGWNNDSGSGGTDFINNAQGGGGNAFSFWRITSTSQTPVKLASIGTTGTGNFSGLAISGTTDSTSTTTGTVTVQGGIGVAGSAYIGGSLTASGTCNASALVSSSTIQESTSGFFANFYRKTNCGTTETYNFQSNRGRFEVFYNANQDRNSSSYHNVDVLANVNGGSMALPIYRGSGVSVSIDTNTNILTINSTVTGGTILINRLMAY